MDTFADVQRVRSAVVRAVVTPLVFLALLAVVLATQVEELVGGARALDRSDEVIARVSALERAVAERESDLRGWLIRREPRDAEAYESSVRAFDEGWDGLVRATGDDPVAVDTLRAIRTLERSWDGSARAAMLGQGIDVDSRTATMDRIHASFRSLAEREGARRAARLAAMQRRARIVLASCLGLTAIAGMLIAIYERARVRGVADAYAGALESLREAVRSRDDFIHAASHELKSPVTALRLQAQSYARRFTGEQRPDVILRSVDRLVALIDHLLDSARAASGRVDLDPEPVDLGSIVGDVVERLREAARTAHCAIELHVESVIGFWDPLRLEQIATNLVTNAMKYGAGKPIAIGVEKDGDRARLVVRDHGIGIAPADQTRIFERFTRAVPERSYRGLGLGLWIVKQIVEAMSGTIEVESAVGEGSTFRVTLPRGEVG